MEPKRFSVWGDLLAAAGIFFAAALAGGICLAVLKTAVPALSGESSKAIAYTVHFLLAIGGIYAYYRRGAPRAARLVRFGLNWFDAPLTLWGIVLVTAASFVLEPLLKLFPDHYFQQLDEAVGSGGWAILLTVVLAPVFEELLFRGLVLEQAMRRWSVLSAVTASALLFGLVHLPNLPQMANAFVMGVLIGYVYVLTRSLVPAIVIHAVNNAVAYLLVEMTGTQNTDTRTLTGNDTVYWTIFAVNASIFAVSLILMARAAGNKTHENTFQKEDE